MSDYVLVHGAWHGGWCWSKVKSHLEASGHRVFTPTMTGLGMNAHLMSRGITMDRVVGDIARLLIDEDLKDSILVGHSFAGPVITGAADREPERVRCLIYLDAAILEDGETMFDLLPAETVKTRLEQAESASGGVSFPVPHPAAFGISDADQEDYLQRHLTPHPVSTYQTPLSLKHRPGTVAPCCYIVCTDPIYPALAAARERVRTYGWPMHELATGHDAMISAPIRTAEMLMYVSENAYPAI